MPAVEPIPRGRIFVDQSAGTRTALALVNVSERRQETVLIVRDQSGLEVDRRTEEFEAGEHRALFIDELFPSSLPPDFIGSLTFEVASGDAGLVAVTLRQNTNPWGEAIFATLPVVDLNGAGNESSLVFPHVGAGFGLSTQLILINPAGEHIRGTLRLTASDGSALQSELAGRSGSEFPIEIEPDGIYQAKLMGREGVQFGYAEVIAADGSFLPSGTVLFQFRSDETVISEAGVAASSAAVRARLYVDNHRTRTGVALASAGNPAGQVTFRLLDRFGQFLAETRRPIDSGGHVAVFADELFARMPSSFTGLLEISTCQYP